MGMPEMLAQMLGINPVELQQQVTQFAAGLANSVKEIRASQQQILEQQTTILETQMELARAHNRLVTLLQNSPVLVQQLSEPEHAAGRINGKQ